MKRNLTIIVAMFVMIISLSACSNSDNENDEANNRTSDENPVVTITMEDDSEIKAELFPDIAPNTVNNFIALIQEGFYDGVIFHRVIPEFMIQGGDPDGAGTGGPGYSIKGEFTSNGFENNLKHERGVLSMARTNEPDSAGSQFFIMVEDAPHLDGDYAAFGKVIEGMDVADRKSTRLNSSHVAISYAVFCLKKKTT